jgi:hypothetical protein
LVFARIGELAVAGLDLHAAAGANLRPRAKPVSLPPRFSSQIAKRLADDIGSARQ